MEGKSEKSIPGKIWHRLPTNFLEGYPLPPPSVKYSKENENNYSVKGVGM